MHTSDLAQIVLDQMGHALTSTFDLHRRNLSGVDQSAHDWAAWLAALTGVEGLDALTLVRWAPVLPTLGLTAKSGRWCPHCLHEDHAAGRPVYWRLAWDVAAVTVCPHHQVELVDACPHCGKRHVRHHGEVVVPGWCTRCGGFLGEGTIETCDSIEAVRARIDRIDREIVALLAERGAYVRQAARFKKSSADVKAPQRVERVIAKVTALSVELGANPAVTEQVYRAMIAGFI